MKETVTKEIVLKVKSYKNDDRYTHLTQEELALLCGTSRTTVNRIIKGDYDHLISEPVKENSDIVTTIPYEVLKRLMACEYAINALINNTKLSTGYDGTLFIDYKVVYGILRAYVPEDTEKRLEELKREED